MTERTVFRCPYCGYEREGPEDVAFYCGPHVASFGGATYPKVRMKPKQPLPAAPVSHGGAA